MSSEELHLDLVGYLAGSLEPGEDERFEAHLDGCERCRRELAELAPLAAALADTDPLKDPPAELRDRVLAAVGGGGSDATARNGWSSRDGSGRSRGDHFEPAPGPSSRSRRSHRPSRLQLGAIIATLAILATAVSLTLTGSGDAEYAATLASPELGGEIELSIREGDGNRLVELEGSDVRGAGSGDFYELWFVGSDDTVGSADRVSAGSFRVSADGDFDVTLSTAIDPADYPRVELTAEPTDGDPTPTPPPLATAELST